MFLQRRVQLHSDAILERPGVKGVSVTVRQHDHRWRVVEVMVQDDNGRTADTYAATLLTPQYWSLKVRAINDSLTQGANTETSMPMGVTFQEYGAVVQQNRRLLIWLPVPSRLASLLGVKLAEVEIYEFFADSSLYGRIVEIRRPHHHRPARHWRGAYGIARRLGITPAIFTSWLGNRRPKLWHRVVIVLAVIGGIPSDITLLIRVLIRAR